MPVCPSRGGRRLQPTRHSRAGHTLSVSRQHATHGSAYRYACCARVRNALSSNGLVRHSLMLRAAAETRNGCGTNVCVPVPRAACHVPVPTRAVQVWKTPSTGVPSGTCQVLVMRFVDGTEKRALFKYR